MKSTNRGPHRKAVLSRDTSPEAEQKQIEIWRAMDPQEKLRLVSSSSRAVQLLALAGMRRRHPQASEEECLLRLAELKLGPELFALVYPDATDLVPS